MVPSGSTPRSCWERGAVDGVYSGESMRISLEATGCARERQKKQHRPVVFSSVLTFCSSDELLLQNDLLLKEKPENQNAVRHFTEQSTSLADAFLLVPSHSDRVKSQRVGFGSDLLTAVREATE